MMTVEEARLIREQAWLTRFEARMVRTLAALTVAISESNRTVRKFR